MKTRRFLAVTVGVMVLSGGLMLTSGHRDAHAAPPADNPGVPNQAILDKLDQVLAALAGAAGQNNHTLRWDTNYPPDRRFTVLTDFNGAAVLDKNTGLVWEQAPNPAPGTFDQATSRCANKLVGGTKGWRLPSVVELMSLLDPTSAAPFVPAVFSLTNVMPEAFYWSATEYNLISGSSGSAWYMGVGAIDFSAQFTPKTANVIRAWCVRGGMIADAY